MATGDVLIFDEAMAYMLDGGWEAADDIKCAILDNTVTPVIGATTPALGDYTVLLRWTQLLILRGRNTLPVMSMPIGVFCIMIQMLVMQPLVL